MITLFRIIAFLEGISYILLLFVATPIKYVLEDQSYVKMLGMPHGILFVAYCILAVLITKTMKWDLASLLLVLIASLIPFGTFYIDSKYFKAKRS